MKRLHHWSCAAAVLLIAAQAGCSAEVEPDSATDRGADTKAPGPIGDEPVSFDGVELVEVIAAGSGCPDGAEIAIDDAGLVTVAFEDYRADSDTLHVACILSMSAQVPAGKRLGLAAATLAGSAQVGSGGTARAAIERAFVGDPADIIDHAFPEGTDGAFELVDDEGVRWSECGDSTIANVHTGLTARDDAAVQADSLALQLVVKDCDAGDPPGDEPPCDDPPGDEPPDDPPGDDPPSDDGALAEIEFGDMIVGGSGCPDGTAEIELSADRSAVSISASDYAVSTSGSLSGTRRACVSRIGVSVPDGIRIGIASASLAGDADIAGGSSGTIHLDKHFPFGDADPVDHELTGAVSGPFSVANDSSVTWSTCGFNGFVAIDSALLVRGSDADMSADTIEATLVAQYCP